MAKLNKLKRKKRQQQLRKSAAQVAQRTASRKSPPTAPAEWQWPEPQADKMDALEALDSFAVHRNQVRRLAEAVGEWAGIPTSIDGEHLVVEPSYPFAKIFNQDRSSEAGITVRNHWHSLQKRCTVFVYEDNGAIHAALEPAFHHLGFEFRTMGCSVAWGIEQEHRALSLLGTLLKHHMFKMYLLTGMFVETSARSGLKYIFRKLRPTVALSPRDKHGNDAGELRILCTLCMHPIAYYQDTWAGAMCPTDDVIAHLMLMRGDEAMLWRRCTQHPSWRPESGL